MRREIYTKDQILKAAYDVAAKRGFKGFTMRNTTREMRISTQPIYLEFKDMEDLKNTLLDSIFEQLKENVSPIERTGDRIIDLGLNYICFAKEHHSPYMTLYIGEHGGGKKMHDSSYNYFREIAKGDERCNQLSDGHIDTPRTGTWVAVTGSASLISSNIMHPTEEQITALIKQTTDLILALDSSEVIRQCFISMNLIGKSVGRKPSMDFFVKKSDFCYLSIRNRLGISWRKLKDSTYGRLAEWQCTELEVRWTG